MQEFFFFFLTFLDFYWSVINYKLMTINYIMNFKNEKDYIQPTEKNLINFLGNQKTFFFI